MSCKIIINKKCVPKCDINDNAKITCNCKSIQSINGNVNHEKKNFVHESILSNVMNNVTCCSYDTEVNVNSNSDVHDNDIVTRLSNVNLHVSSNTNEKLIPNVNNECSFANVLISSENFVHDKTGNSVASSSMKYVTTHHDHYDISDSIDFCSKEINRLKSPSTIGNVNINLNVCAVCNQSVNTCVCNNNVNQKVHVSSTCGECLKKVTLYNDIVTCSQCSLDFHLKCTDKINSTQSNSNWLCKLCFTKICIDELPFPTGQFIDPRLNCHLGRGLKIVHINIQSLKNKIDHLHIFMHFNDIDILCVTETWLKSDIDDNELIINGYNMCRKDRRSVDGEHGGIVVYLKEGIDFDDAQIDVENDIEALFLDINLPCTKSILLGTVYRKPSANAEYLSKLDLVLQKATANYNESIIVGDFNLDMFKPNLAKKVNNLAKNSNLTQLITEATRITPDSETLLDLALVSCPDMISVQGVHHINLSDHSMIYVVRKCKKIRVTPKITKSRSYKNFNETNFIESLQTKNWNLVTNQSDVNNAWSIWSNMFIDVCDKHAPMKEKRIRTYLPDWITSDFLKLSKDRDFYYNKACKTNDPLDWNKAKALRNKVNNLNKSLKKNFYNKEIENNLKDSKKLWKTIKKVIPNKTKNSVGNIKTENRNTTNDTDTANVFNNYFTSIGTKLADKINSNDDNVHVITDNDGNIDNPYRECSEFNFQPITAEYVFDQICNLTSNKSPGLDTIDVTLFKAAAPIISNSLAYICNLSLSSSIFPSEWKIAKVVPIFKSGCKSNVENYRPISVLSIVSKIIERAVHDQLYSHLTVNNLLSSSQSGFRSQYSTATTIIDVQDYILNNMDEGKVTGAIFLDLKKAFDTVDHQLLINKLMNYGISSIELKWFKSYLNGRKQSVKIGSSLSSLMSIDIGIPQGSILGPLLFIIFVNDLPNNVVCKAVMYADDTSLLVSSSDPLSLQNSLNYNLNLIARWFKENNLTLNLDKTKFMLFGTTHNLDKFKDISLIYDGNVIEQVDHFKYLGIVFDCNMTWSHHIDFIASNVSKRCGIIRRVKYFLPNHILKKLAEALVMSQFDYCSHAWSNCSQTLSHRLQVLQNNLARIVLSADARTPTDFMMTTLKWLKLDKRWDNHILVMLFKCLIGRAPDYLSCNFNFTNSIHYHNTRGQSSNSLVVPHHKSNSGMRSFQVRAANLWNNAVDSNIRSNFMSYSIGQFKSNALAIPK